MANDRIDVSIVGIMPVRVSYLIDDSSVTYDVDEVGGSSSVGLAMTLSAANTIATAGDGEFVLGKLLKVEADGVATVQIGGGMTLPAGTGAGVTLGKAIVGDLLVAAEGYIREGATGTAAELGVCRGHISDAGTTTAVEVYL